jgi:SAM-dependent methyltransferase
MVELARREHPDLAFEVGEMGALDVPDADLAGLLAWYSLIHVPARRRPAVVAELRRVLRPGGYLLVAFQVGTDALHLDEAFGHQLSLDFHRLEPDAVVELLEDAGFELVARLVRAPDDDGPAAAVPQAVVVVRRSGSPGPAEDVENAGAAPSQGHERPAGPHA